MNGARGRRSRSGETGVVRVQHRHLTKTCDATFGSFNWRCCIMSYNKTCSQARFVAYRRQSRTPYLQHLVVLPWALGEEKAVTEAAALWKIVYPRQAATRLQVSWTQLGRRHSTRKIIIAKGNTTYERNTAQEAQASQDKKMNNSRPCDSLLVPNLGPALLLARHQRVTRKRKFCLCFSRGRVEMEHKSKKSSSLPNKYQGKFAISAASRRTFGRQLLEGLVTANRVLPCTSPGNVLWQVCRPKRCAAGPEPGYTAPQTSIVGLVQDCYQTLMIRLRWCGLSRPWWWRINVVGKSSCKLTILDSGATMISSGLEDLQPSRFEVKLSRLQLGNFPLPQCQPSAGRWRAGRRQYRSATSMHTHTLDGLAGAELTTELPACAKRSITVSMAFWARWSAGCLGPQVRGSRVGRNSTRRM
eukprot:284817559_1